MRSVSCWWSLFSSGTGRRMICGGQWVDRRTAAGSDRRSNQVTWKLVLHLGHMVGPVRPTIVGPNVEKRGIEWMAWVATVSSN